MLVQGEWTEVKGKKKLSDKKSRQELSPKNNPFMMYSDFKAESRFLIDRRKEMTTRKPEIVASRVSDDRDTSKDIVLIEDLAEDSEDFDDDDFEKNLNFMSCEDKVSKRIERDSKRKEREIHMFNWNGTDGNSTKDTQETLGRGQRSHVKKRSYG
ncbi:hypothetical protein MKX01_035821 [Papaver californicum]|nr:hypothetical protein MKX01_035821 [Papaver californicum]